MQTHTHVHNMRTYTAYAAAEVSNNTRKTSAAVVM